MTGEVELTLPVTRFSRAVDTLLERMAGAMSWLWLALVVVIVLNVVMRYLFAEGRIEFEEIQWHLYAMGFLLGLSSAYANDVHIRVDVLRVRWSAETQAWIELYGILLLLLPFVVLVLTASVPFVSYSFATAEVSEAPGGLPFRWFVKSFLFSGFGLLLVAAMARLSRVTAFLFGWPADSNHSTGGR